MQSNENKHLKPLPVGESDLASMLKGNCIYVDKTKHVYDLVKTRGKYFLSRPRRFGKSTLISTFYEIFRGNKELFKDQWIYNSDYKWDEYPIIRMDFNASTDADIEYHIKDSLQIVATQYNIQLDWNMPYYVIFKHLIIELHQKYQRQ